MTRLATPKTGDYPRFFATRLNTELLTLLASNGTTLVSSIADALQMNRSHARECFLALAKTGIVVRGARARPGGRLVSMNRAHPAFNQAAVLLRCLARRFQPPRIEPCDQRGPIPVPTPTQVDPADLIGTGDGRDVMILIALLGQTNTAALQTALTNTQANMHRIVERLRDEHGLVTSQRVGRYVLHRIADGLACRDAFIGLLRKIGRLNPTYLGMAQVAREEQPEVVKLTRR